MSYIFRLNTALSNGQGTLPNQIEDWGNTNNMGYTQIEIAQIPPSNPNSTNEPTSIPSPFARLALTKTAFSEVATKGTNALMAYQQIVSNSLDVAEIFFNFKTLQNHAGLEIVKWSFSDLQNIQSPILKSTLELFFQGDAQALNLSNTTTLYFLRHINTGKIIGGTSPRTLFFSASNVKRRKGGVVEPEFIYPDGEFFVKNEITLDEARYGKIELSNNHFAFSDIKPLSKRDIKFQDYLHTWVKTNKDIESILPELSTYLSSQKEADKTAHFNALPNNLSTYTQIKFDDSNGNSIYPEVFGRELLEQNNEVNPDESDFIVKSTIFNGSKPPMILGGTASGIENWQLDGDTKWGTRTVSSSQDRNILPDGGIYPWLTADDFFESKIIQLPKSIIGKDYFSGNHTNSGEKSVLLPLKDKLFEYFTIAELRGMLKIDGSAAIKVTLVIPVNDGNKKVTFCKEYKNSDIITLSSETDFMLFPNVKFNDAVDSFYRFGLFREFSEVKKMTARFYNQSNEVILNDTNEIITRNENDNLNHRCTTYALEGKEFDRVKIQIDGTVGGIIIPELKPKMGNIDFTFAVDFGTTNTHIEYRTSTDGNIKPFDITADDEQISWFANPGERVCQTRLVADIDFIPEHIGYKDAKNIKVKFPTRTALLVANNAATDMKLPFVHTNIVLPFDKRIVPQYNGMPITKLKWESGTKEVCYYIENLCYLMRNKVVLNNGSLSKTKILWTYPLSMNGTRIDEISDIWHTAYKKYFGTQNVDENCKQLTESLAPFYHYSSLPDYREYIKDLVSIDIGGGTTDVVFVKDGKPSYVTSFRFAANDLFGLGENVRKIISKHKQTIEKDISELGHRSILANTMNSIEQNTKFGDLASFLFSLKDNEDLTEKGKIIDFNSILAKDNNQKLVILLFYAAIIYHTAQVMNAKSKGGSMPRHLTFSGNGSRIVNVLGKKNMLEKIATLVFEKIFSQKYGSDGQPKKLEIIPSTNNPKEVTCKGGINSFDKQIENLSNDVLLGIDSSTFAKNDQTYADLKNNQNAIDEINNHIDVFFNYVFDELLKCEIKKQIGTESIQEALLIPKTAIDKAKETLSHKNELNSITQNRLKEKEGSDKIKETFFFLPIPTLLSTISREIENKED